MINGFFTKLILIRAPEVRLEGLQLSINNFLNIIVNNTHIHEINS